MTTTQPSNSDLVSLFNDADVQYRDLDLRMSVHPLNNQLVTLKEVTAVKRALFNLLMTTPGERPFNPRFGVPFYKVLFELLDVNTLTIHNMINLAVEQYEPRVKVTKINVVADPDNNSLSIDLAFTILRLQEETTLNVFIRRTK